MSETLPITTNPDLVEVTNAAQEAHNADIAIRLSGSDAATETEQIPQASATTQPEVAPANPAEAVAESLNPDRALVRFGRRLLSFQDRRTAKQIAGEKKDAAIKFTSERAEAVKAGAKEVATKVGAATTKTSLSTFAKASELGYNALQKKDDLKTSLYAKREAAQNRKKDRIAERQKQANVNTVIKTIEKRAKAFDKSRRQDERIKERTANKARRADTRAELAEKTKRTAKFAGKAALMAGVGVAAVPVVAGYGAYKGGKLGAEVAAKGARKTIEVVKDTGEAVSIKVTRGVEATKTRTRTAQFTHHAKRAARLYDRSERLSSKAKSAYVKHEAIWEKAQKLEEKIK